jgi:hypothetical protein
MLQHLWLQQLPLLTLQLLRQLTAQSRKYRVNQKKDSLCKWRLFWITQQVFELMGLGSAIL